MWGWVWLFGVDLFVEVFSLIYVVTFVHFIYVITYKFVILFCLLSTILYFGVVYRHVFLVSLH